MSNKALLTFVYVLAVVLLFIRIDLWWWGTKIHPIIAGWITLPMLYQLGIWAAGVALIFIVCFAVWKDDSAAKGGN
ncbi:MAG: hypothetical protein JXA18_13550 [Chitinispirillaceae bacterium]|nr:hypothetical protein [Chitinispirillaceae bacterium]